MYWEVDAWDDTGRVYARVTPHYPPAELAILEGHGDWEMCEHFRHLLAGDTPVE